MSIKTAIPKLILALLMLSFLMTGCSGSGAKKPAPDTAPLPTPQRETPGPAFDLTGGFERPAYQDLPEEIQQWVDNSRVIMLGQSRVHGDFLYILVTYGEKPTGGFEVAINDLVQTADRLLVKVRFTDPEPGQPVTQAVTFPYDLVVTSPTDWEVNFEAVGEERHVPTLLLGIEHLEPIVAGRAGIQVFSPAPESKVKKAFRFRGIANTFEGNVIYRVQTPDGKTLVESFTTGAQGDWGLFQETVEVPAAAPADIELRVFAEDAEDGSIRNDFIIPLRLVEN